MSFIHPTNNPDHARRFAGRVSLILSSLIMLVKMLAYEMTGSQAVLSDALESIVNVIAAIVALMVIGFASQPADRDHPYGHGKAEHVSAGFEGGAITLAGITIVLSSLQSLWQGLSIRSLDLGLLMILGAGLVNGGLGVYLLSQGKKTHSPALTASARHVLTDFWTTVAIILGLLAVKVTQVLWLDPIIAIVVGLRLSYSGYGLMKETGAVLLDAEEPSLIQKLVEIFTKIRQAGIIRIHHTRIMRSGRFHHVDLHLVMPEFWTIDEAHEESARFEKKVIDAYPVDCELHAHIDPCRQAYCKMCELSDCPIRKRPFEHRQAITVEELTSPEEPVEYLQIQDQGRIPHH